MKKAFPVIILILVILAGGLYFGYNYLKKKEIEKREAQKKDLPVFRIEEKVYTLSDFENYLKVLNPEKQEVSAEALAELFDQFIEDKLILYSARKQGLVLTDSEKQAFLKRMIRDYPVEAGLSEALARDQSLEESLLVEKYKRQKVAEAVVTEEEIKQYYQEHKKDFLLPERVKVSQILVKSSDQAVKLRERLQKASEEEFRQAAKDFSEAPDAYKGGVMGVYKPGELPYEMEKIIFSLEEGKLSAIFQSTYGFHIFRLDKKYPPTLLSLEEAASKIRNLLLEIKVKDIVAKEIEDLKTTYHWQVFPENLPFKYEGKEYD